MASFPLRQSVCLLSCWADLGWGEARCNSLQKTLNNRSKCWIGNSKSQWTCLPFITGAIYSRLGESPQQDKLELFTRAKCISARHNRGDPASSRQYRGHIGKTLYLVVAGARACGRGWAGRAGAGRGWVVAASRGLQLPRQPSPAQARSMWQPDFLPGFVLARPGPGPPALTNTEAIFKSVFCFCAIGWKRTIVSARRRGGTGPLTTQPGCQ